MRTTQMEKTTHAVGNKNQFQPNENATEGDKKL